ncbi:MAG: c-type cytochrome [Cyanobacteria bacterium REEB67]|nr:c-type cytochrome [Cyanobacteria bacterium REEB67]
MRFAPTGLPSIFFSNGLQRLCLLSILFGLSAIPAVCAGDQSLKSVAPPVSRAVSKSVSMAVSKSLVQSSRGPARSVGSAGAKSQAEPESGGNAARIVIGQELFVKATCIGCHARGENALNGDKPLKGQAFLKKYAEDKTFINFVRRGSPERGMPPFSRQRLSDDDLKNILCFIRTFSTSSTSNPVHNVNNNKRR